MYRLIIKSYSFKSLISNGGLTDQYIIVYFFADLKFCAENFECRFAT